MKWSYYNNLLVNIFKILIQQPYKTTKTLNFYNYYNYKGGSSSSSLFSLPSSASLCQTLTSIQLLIIIILLTICLQDADACLSWFSTKRSNDKLSSSPTERPAMTDIPTFTCPTNYDEHYCLNGATCFSIKVGDSMLYNCECVTGYVGQRCEFKDLDQSYLPSRQRALFQQAGITSIVVIIVIVLFIAFIFLYIRLRRRKASSETNGDDYEKQIPECPPTPVVTNEIESSRSAGSERDNAGLETQDEDGLVVLNLQEQQQQPQRRPFSSVKPI